MNRKKRLGAWFRLVAKTTITIAMFWMLLRQTDLESILRQMSSIEPVFLFLATALGVFLAIIAGLRWYHVILASGHRLSGLRTLEITLIGTFFNQLLPSAMGGDLARIPYAHRSGLPLMTAVNTIIADRILSLIALTLLVFVCLPISFSLIPNLQARWGLLLIALAGFAGTAFLLCLERMPNTLSRLSVFKHFHHLSSLLSAALFRGQAFAILSYGIISHLVRVSAVYAIAIGMQLDVSFHQCLILVPPAMLVTNLPISVGGWGLREGAFVIAFGLMGIAAESAFALSAVFGLTTIAASLIGGLCWILHGKSAIA